MKKIKIGLNKFTFLLVFIYFLVGVGASYAYFAFNYENDSEIVGNVVGVDATLTVKRVVGTDEKLVPMMDAALSNALNAVGTTNGACIDSLGNLSCQVYEITLTNNATRIHHLVGSIELYPKEGTNSAYSNLKWQELTNTTTIKEGAIINGMNESILVSGLTMEPKETKTWYIGVWLSEIDDDQKDIDKGEFQGTVTFEVNESLTEGGSGGEIVQTPFITNVMGANSTNDAILDFSKTSTQTTTNGIYVKNGTQDDPYPIYYYRGVVDNNLIFANFCWKIVRTTETGGLKLIYNGVPTNGTCNNTGTASQIGTSNFNSLVGGVGHLGYMYHVDGNGEQVSLDGTAYYYGSGVSYSNGTYTLTNPVFSDDWSTFRNSDNGVNTHHYTCLSDGITCDVVSYLYRAYDDRVYYYNFYNGETITEYLIDLLGADETDPDDFNIKSSTLKESIDYWYYNNIDQKGYGSYLEDTVWCNDRTIGYKAGLEPAWGNINVNLIFNAFNRTTGSPNLNCSRRLDSFTVSSANGNGNLEFPVGLLTMDEMTLAGGVQGQVNASYYLYTGQPHWSISPGVYTEYCFGSYIDAERRLKVDSAANYFGIRPSISLKAGFSLTGNGDGKAATPYMLE